MQHYTPSYTLSERMMGLVSAISEKVGRIAGRNDLESRPHLRRNNTIRSIHSTLRIEANTLTLNEVRDVISGHPVAGDRKEIQEVKNAFAAYELIPEIDPSSMAQLKRIHGVMTHLTVEESGEFRRGNVGVFSGDACIFVAPPPHMVTGLMQDLLAWLKKSDGSVHPLIASAVFHYEFVFIHPFADGNGRMARLWHTVILSRWRSVFRHIPLESRIERSQKQYYDAIAQCHANGNADVFIGFMLDMIDQALDEVIAQADREQAGTDAYVKRLLDVMEYGVPYALQELLERLGLRSRETLRRHYLHPAMEAGLVRMTLPDRPSSKNQRYVRP